MHVADFQFFVAAGAFLEYFQRILDAVATVNVSTRGRMRRLDVLQADGTVMPKLFLG